VLLYHDHFGGLVRDRSFNSDDIGNPCILALSHFFTERDGGMSECLCKKGVQTPAAHQPHRPFLVETRHIDDYQFTTRPFLSYAKQRNKSDPQTHLLDGFDRSFFYLQAVRNLRAQEGLK
jgi:hypothetical protein